MTSSEISFPSATVQRQPSTASTTVITVNEMAVLANAVMDHLEAVEGARAARVRRWRSPDGSTEIVRYTASVSPAQVFQYVPDAFYSRIVICQDGSQCFTHKDLMWPGSSEEIEQVARISPPRACVDNLLAFHRAHDTWVNEVYGADKRSATVKERPRPRHGFDGTLDYPQRWAPDPSAVRQRVYPTRPSAIHRMVRP